MYDTFMIFKERTLHLNDLIILKYYLRYIS